MGVVCLLLLIMVKLWDDLGTRIRLKSIFTNFDLILVLEEFILMCKLCLQAIIQNHPAAKRRRSAASYHDTSWLSFIIKYPTKNLITHWKMVNNELPWESRSHYCDNLLPETVLHSSVIP